MNGTKRFSPPFRVDSAAASRRCVAASRRGSATHTPGRVLSGASESNAGTRDRRSSRRRVVTLRVAHAVGRAWCGHYVVGREGGSDRTECSRVGHVGASVSKVRPVAAASLRRSAPLRVAVLGFPKPSGWSNSVRPYSAGISPERAESNRHSSDVAAMNLNAKSTRC